MDLLLRGLGLIVKTKMQPWGGPLTGPWEWGLLFITLQQGLLFITLQQGLLFITLQHCESPWRGVRRQGMAAANVCLESRTLSVANVCLESRTLSVAGRSGPDGSDQLRQLRVYIASRPN